VLKRTVKEFREDDLTDWAAALTYYTILALFPALIVLALILGLLGQNPQTTDALLKIVRDLGPSSAVDTFRGPIQSLITNKRGAGVLLLVGLATALWSASSYVGAFMRASNAIYEIEEGRPFWKLRPTQLAITLVMILLLAVVGISVVVTGPLARAIAEPIGLGDVAVTVWNIAKWPVLLGVMMLMLAILYYWTPNVRQPKFKWITPGSVLAVIIWIVSSAAFAVYVANFGSYDKVYGSLGGVVIGLIWLWISNIAVLLGQELNAELERERELQSGDHRAHRELQLEPRDAPD
jgi:membrane protein